MVVAYLRDQRYHHITSEYRYDGAPANRLVEAAVSSGADVIVNCAGITTQRGITDARIFVANSLLPQHLAARLASSQLLIHASTDCVFQGTRGMYAPDETPDAVDAYGLSKRLGEYSAHPPGANVIIMRTSIVGPERGSSRGLLSWFLNQSGNVNGWTDHLWNGITTLQWAQLCVQFATSDDSARGVHHPTTDQIISKYEMLTQFADVFDHRVSVKPVETGDPVDRTLQPTQSVPPLIDQLRELRGWMPRAYR